jgi:hypothetical protein
MKQVFVKRKPEYMDELWIERCQRKGLNPYARMRAVLDKDNPYLTIAPLSGLWFYSKFDLCNSLVNYKNKHSRKEVKT